MGYFIQETPANNACKHLEKLFLYYCDIDTAEHNRARNICVSGGIRTPIFGFLRPHSHDGDRL